MRSEVYLIALEGMPAFAIDQAVRWWLQGSGGDGSENYAFAPSAPQLRRLADKAAFGVVTRRYELRQLLAARVYTPPTPEMRAQVAMMLDRFRSGRPITGAGE